MICKSAVVHSASPKYHGKCTLVRHLDLEHLVSLHAVKLVCWQKELLWMWRCLKCVEQCYTSGLQGENLSSKQAFLLLRAGRNNVLPSTLLSLAVKIFWFLAFLCAYQTGLWLGNCEFIAPVKTGDHALVVPVCLGWYWGQEYFHQISFKEIPTF